MGFFSKGFFLKHVHDYQLNNRMNNHKTNHMIIIRQKKIEYHVNNKVLFCSTLLV